MENRKQKRLFNFHNLERIKSQIRRSNSVRGKIIESVGYNINLIPNQCIFIDLFTDSLLHFILPKKTVCSKGNIQSSYLSLKDTVKKCFGYKYVLPVAQGRMAEAILAKIMVKNAMVVPSNMLFVTTRFHQELNGATVLEIPVNEAYDFHSNFPFKGNMDAEKLKRVISEYGNSWIPYIYVETCVNASGGHPVSMGNIKEISWIAKSNKIPVILDACRILENAYLIREREKGYSNKSILEIVREFCSYTDGCTMSASKDFFIESGAFIATNNQELYYKVQDAILVFGDGLPISTKAALNDVIWQTFNREEWIRDRVEKVRYLWGRLKKDNLPVLNPPGGHAVFLDINDLYNSLPAENYPEQAFLVHFYISSGVRTGGNILTPYQEKQAVRMLRLIIPTRMYSLKDMDYVAKCLKSAWENRKEIQGLRKVYQPSSLGGSLFAEYELVGTKIDNKWKL